MIGQKDVAIGRFGNFDMRENFLELALENTFNVSYEENRIIKDSLKISEKLKNLKNTLQKKEKKFYKALNCNGFSDFKKMWEGRNVNNNQILEYWLNKHLDLLTGQAQRIISGKNWTFIEQLLELVSIKLDVNESLEIGDNPLAEGLNAKLRRSVKKLAAIAENNSFATALLEEVSAENYQAVRDKGKTVFVPAKTKGGRRFTEDEIIQGMIDLFAQNEKDMSKRITNDGAAAILQALQEIWTQKKNNEFYYQTAVYGRNTKASLSNIFITLHFSKSDKRPEKIAQSTCRELMRYFRAARPLGFTPEVYNAWKSFAAQNGEEIIEMKFLQLLQDFLRNNRNSYEKFLTNESNILGFFGELSAYGKGYFNIKNLKDVDANLFWTGALTSAQTSGQLSYDLVLRINNENYGIQVTNPYQTQNGYYKTYEDTFSLGRNEKDKEGNRFYENYLNLTDEDQIKCFQHLNLNMNNPVNKDELEQAIMGYFYLHSDRFIRIFSESIREDVFEEQLKEELKDNRAINVFFILKGQIFPSSAILSALIEQYEYFINGINKKSQYPLTLKYINPIQVTKVPDNDATLQFQPEYVVTNTENLLSRIKLKTSLTLTIPSMNDFINL